MSEVQMNANGIRRRWFRHPLTIVGATVALAGGLTLQMTVASAGTSPNAVDYAQCTNGAPGTTAPTGCNSWINGILNGNNSQYHEDQATAQRLLVGFTDAASGNHVHSVTLKYLTRKNGVHAYDSLTSVDATQTDAATDAVRCQGLGAFTGICPGPSTVHDSQPVVDDNTVVNPYTSSSGVTKDHQLPGNLKIFGATFTTDGQTDPGLPGYDPAYMTPPSHDNAAASTGDDYATTTISFKTPSGAGLHYVQLLFGGHLAAPTQDRGWGTGLGASSINGGPYHIKWTAADGMSIGNRDNQIMSSAILPIIAQGTGLQTSPDPSGTITIGASSLAAVKDVAHIDTSGSGHAPTGTVTFDLYGPFTSAPGASDCVDPANSIDGNRLYQDANVAVSSTANASGTYAGDYDSTSGTFDASSSGVGIYQWVAHYSGDTYNLAEDGSCGDTTEQFTVQKSSGAGSSTQTLTDTVTVADDGTNGTPTGTVSFYAYTTSDCSNTAAFSDTDVSLDGSGSATSSDFTPSPAAGGTTYYWKVTYSGDDTYNGGTVETCGTQQATIQNAPAS